MVVVITGTDRTVIPYQYNLFAIMPFRSYPYVTMVSLNHVICLCYVRHVSLEGAEIDWNLRLF